MYQVDRPLGLALTSNGRDSGVPTIDGIFHLHAKVTDTLGGHGDTGIGVHEDRTPRLSQNTDNRPVGGLAIGK